MAMTQREIISKIGKLLVETVDLTNKLVNKRGGEGGSKFLIDFVNCEAN
jgi:hypothetical protein